MAILRHKKGSALFTPASGAVSKTVSGLTTGQIYAFHLNYTTTAGKKVFSARDAYVYPSQSFPRQPSGANRVATFPLFGHWPSKEYVYSVCNDTFPSDNWSKLIKHAFKQWETSTRVVTMTPSTIDCDVDKDVPLSMIRSIFNQTNEVFMVDTSSVGLAVEFGFDVSIRQMSHSALFGCVYLAPACAISTEYRGDDEASTMLTNAENSVDILVNKNHEDILWRKFADSSRVPREVNIPGNDLVHSADDVKFNGCTPTSSNATDFYLYETMLHESGHALGLSAFSIQSVPSVPFGSRSGYVGSHPTIPDTVMNYDHESPFLYDASLPENERWIRPLGEPNCSPHPFDIMAIYALYQTVSP